jgi:hypothetical protein
MKTPVVHVENAFEFTVDAPFETTAPLFGGSSERKWGQGKWNPQFLYPQPERDAPGAVFLVGHGHTQSTWVNTAYDLAAGRFQYVCFVPDAQVAVVDVQVASETPSRTKVKVVYRRTALDPAFNDHVAALGSQDLRSGPDWSEAIDESLRSAPQ